MALAELVRRLGARRDEIEQTLLTRVYSVSDPREVADPEYAAGLRSSVSAALDYGLAAIGGRSGEVGSVPSELLVQARQAARNGVSLDTVLRRYFAGYALLEDFILGEIEASPPLEASLHRLSRVRAATFDRLIEAIADEYRFAAEEHSSLQRRRRADCIERLLAGRPVEEAELGYPLEDWHLGLVASGGRVEPAMRELARACDRRSLILDRGEGVTWAWLGGRRRLGSAEIAEHARGEGFEGLSLSIGEPTRGLGGWRLTHRQALAALPIAIRGGANLVRYSEVCLLATSLNDDTLVRSLQELYLAPLEKHRGGGSALRETLRTYFGSGENVSSTAASLRVSRQTVTNRLATVEQELGRPLESCGREIELALELAELSAC